VNSGQKKHCSELIEDEKIFSKKGKKRYLSCRPYGAKASFGLLTQDCPFASLRVVLGYYPLSLRDATLRLPSIAGALRATQLKLGLQSRPGDALAPVFVERSKAAVKLLPLLCCQGKVVVFQAVPKLRDERQALRRGKTHKLIMGE
jgi:hypothetical protein